MSLRSAVHQFSSQPWMANITAILGGAVYLIQAWIYAHTQASILDEGSYLYKGYLFATGQYIPFQEYGPWNNHMPLSFLIPGYFQSWFGPGLRTGRYFSIALGLLLLFGLWIVARRLGGKWWGAGAVWALALNPYFSSVYSLAFSQVLVACMLIWVMVLILDEKVAVWRIALGSVLAGLLLLTRLNMAIVLPLLIIYVFWQYGFKAGMTAAIVGSLTVVIGHALFWPGILRLWASWLPASQTPFLNTWRIFDQGQELWNPQISLEKRWLSFWQGIRSNFVPMVAFIGFGLLGFQSRYWKSAYFQRIAIFLSILIAFLLAAHAWASLWNNYCVFCFSGYLTFFSPLALLLIIVVIRGWEGSKSIWFATLASILILIVSAGIGYASYQEIGPWIIEMPIPRIKDGRFVGGFGPLWGVLEGALGLQNDAARALLSILFGLTAGIMLLLITWVIFRRKQIPAQKTGFGMLAISILLIVGFILTPTNVLGGGYVENDCSDDVLAAQEVAGYHLAANIPPGSQIYWNGPLSVVPLLHAPRVNMYPPQINDGYTFRLGGNEDDLLRFGFWNTQLARQWRQEADFIIIEEERYTQNWKDFLETGEFLELSRTPTTNPCQKNAGLRIFRRISQE